ncbi:MAG: HDOD domain-containing protein [Kofleriaceae bacterium]
MMVATADPNAKLVGALGQIVLGRISSGRLVLPVMPAVAQKCLALLRDENVQQKRLTAELEREPLLVASILRSSMTAARGGATVKTLDQAVSSLGLQKLKSLLVEFMTRQLFRSTDKRIQAATVKVWEHSVAVAVLARDIAALTSGANSDTCYLAGLLHDVGKPILVAMLLEAEKQLTKDKSAWLDINVWTSTIEQVHRKVGTALAIEWKLPDEVTAGIRDCSEYDTANRTGAANVVRFANALAKREGYATGPSDATEIDALIMIGRSMVGADEAAVEGMVAGLAERVAQAA